jgi:hypothetical protein
MLPKKKLFLMKATLLNKFFFIKVEMEIAVIFL